MSPWKSFSKGKEWQILVLVDRKETIFYAKMDWEQKHWGVPSNALYNWQTWLILCVLHGDFFLVKKKLS